MTATTEGATTLYTAEMAITMPRNPYRFKLLSKEGAYYLNAQGISRADSPDAHDFNLLADFHTPEWVSTAVFYEIFPDRFFNGDPANDIPEGAWENRGFKTQRRNWAAAGMNRHSRKANSRKRFGKRFFFNRRWAWPCGVG